MTDTPKTYTIDARQAWILKATIDHEFAARAADPAQIDATLDEVGVTNPHERMHLKAIAGRPRQVEAVMAKHADYEDGRKDGSIPDSDLPGTGAAAWETLL
jgi:hypothetical protein